MGPSNYLISGEWWDDFSWVPLLYTMPLALVLFTLHLLNRDNKTHKYWNVSFFYSMDVCCIYNNGTETKYADKLHIRRSSKSRNLTAYRILFLSVALPTKAYPVLRARQWLSLRFCHKKHPEHPSSWHLITDTNHPEIMHSHLRLACNWR